MEWHGVIQLKLINQLLRAIAVAVQSVDMQMGTELRELLVLIRLQPAHGHTSSRAVL